MTVSQAVGLCAALVVLAADPVDDDEQFSRLLADLGIVSPVIEPVEPGHVYVGVDGLDRLHGSPRAQLDVIRQTLERTADGRPWHGVRLGWARGRFAAWVAARRARPGRPCVVDPTPARQAAFLAAQPVAALPISSDTHRRLAHLGIRTLGELAALPLNAVVSQFGREGRAAWMLAAGHTVEPVIGSVAPEPIVTAVDFPLPIGDRYTLEQALDTLVGRALRHPRRIGWRVQSLRVRAALEHGSSWSCTAVLKDPSASRASLTAPLFRRLEQSPPAGAVDHLSVELTAFVRGTAELQLFSHDATAAARAGRRRALRWAVREIRTRLRRSLLHHVIEVHPWSRIPERRYALIDYDP